MFRTRASLYKLIMMTSLVQLLYFGLKSYSSADSTILSVLDLLSREDLKDDDTFKLVRIFTLFDRKYCVVKPGSLSYDSYSNTYKFVGTDHKGNGINILYKGDLKFETREGETVVLTGYLPDADNRTQMIAIEYLTNHALEKENWDGKYAESLISF